MAGRPRKTSVDDLLERAGALFWDKGYDATSMGDLTKALGVGPSSLYNTFGSKSGLYLAAMERYIAQEGGFYAEALALPHVYDAIDRMLGSAAVLYTRGDCPRGCAVLAQGPSIDCTVEDHMRHRRIASRERIADRLREGVDAGQLRPDTDVDALARFVTATLQGLSQQARDGATSEALQAMVRIAMGAFPDERP